MTEVSGQEVCRCWTLSEFGKVQALAIDLIFSRWCVETRADGQEEKAAIDSRLVALKAGETIHPNPIFF